MVGVLAGRDCFPVEEVARSVRERESPWAREDRGAGGGRGAEGVEAAGVDKEGVEEAGVDKEGVDKEGVRVAGIC